MYFDAKSVFHSYCLHIGMLASFSYRQKKTNKSISLVHKQSVCVLFQSMNIMQGPSHNHQLSIIAVLSDGGTCFISPSSVSSSSSSSSSLTGGWHRL